MLLQNGIAPTKVRSIHDGKLYEAGQRILVSFDAKMSQKRCKNNEKNQRNDQKSRTNSIKKEKRKKEHSKSASEFFSEQPNYCVYFIVNETAIYKMFDHLSSTFFNQKTVPTNSISRTNEKFGRTLLQLNKDPFFASSSCLFPHIQRYFSFFLIAILLLLFVCFSLNVSRNFYQPNAHSLAQMIFLRQVFSSFLSLFLSLFLYLLLSFSFSLSFSFFFSFPFLFLFSMPRTADQIYIVLPLLPFASYFVYLTVMGLGNAHLIAIFDA